MAKQKRKVFHSSLAKNGWVVTEGGETVSRNSNQKANEAAAIAAGRKAYEDGGLGQAVLHMASFPIETNVLFLTIKATKMPFEGRG